MKLGKYKHFKGNEYEVIGIAKDCEDPNKEYVVYKSLYGGDFPYGQTWIRELNNFNENKMIDGKETKRFIFLEENKVKIKIKKINEKAILPNYAHPGDAGLDLYSCEDYVLKSGERKLFKTGLTIELPEGYVALIRDKSGLAYKNGITVLGGVIEHTYRGDYGIILLNTGKEDFAVSKGQKIAQLLIQPIISAEVEEVEELSETLRGEGGFGSTGK